MRSRRRYVELPSTRSLFATYEAWSHNPRRDSGAGLHLSGRYRLLPSELGAGSLELLFRPACEGSVLLLALAHFARTCETVIFSECGRGSIGRYQPTESGRGSFRRDMGTEIER
jgi:hypothetical protein